MSAPEFSPFAWPVPVLARPCSKASPASARGDPADGSQTPSGGDASTGINILSARREGRITVRCLEDDMSSFLQSCVERYQELIPKRTNLRQADIQYLEDFETADMEEPRGELQPIASRLLIRSSTPPARAGLILRPIDPLGLRNIQLEVSEKLPQG